MTAISNSHVFTASEKAFGANELKRTATIKVAFENTDWEKELPDLIAMVRDGTDQEMMAEAEHTLGMMARKARAAIWVELNGRDLPGASITYLLNNGLKQSLADSFANAGTQKNKEGQLLSLSDRKALWQGLYDKRLDKIIAGTIGVSDSVEKDPFEAECLRFAAIKLKALAEKQGKTLPKATEPKYKELLASVRNSPKYKADIEAKAKEALAIRDEAKTLGDDELELDI